jgi:hypothetical protein
LISGDAGHPAPQTVVAIGPILLLRSRGGKITAGDIELIPANSRCTGAVNVGADGMRRPQRFGATAILINNRRHDFIAQRVQALRRSLLWHKQSRRIRECVDEPVDCDLGVRGVVWA